MKPVLIGWLLLLALAAAPARAESPAPMKLPPGDYALDPQRSRLIAKVQVGFWRYAVRFDSLSGSFAYDPADWQATRVAIVVDPASAADRNGRRIAAYFEPKKYPVIRFTSTQLIPVGEGRGELQGDLTLHGVTRPVVLRFAVQGAPPGEGARMRFTGAGRVRRSDFGMRRGPLFAGDDVDLLFAVEFARTPAAAQP
jgi:polyisoprenoid-binding protein YceI